MRNSDSTENCIYCVNGTAEDRDHVPPQCFFSTPRPSNLITVPACAKCNWSFGKVDERARNLLTSLESTEGHQAITSQLAAKRDRSYKRGKGTNLQYMLQSMKLIDYHSPGGIYLGKRYAFKLDQSIMNEFFERMARGLLYHRNSIGYFKGSFKWFPAPDFHELSEKDKKYFASGVSYTIGDRIFKYAGYYFSETPKSLWLMRFYDGMEVMVAVKPND